MPILVDNFPFEYEFIPQQQQQKETGWREKAKTSKMAEKCLFVFEALTNLEKSKPEIQ